MVIITFFCSWIGKGNYFLKEKETVREVTKVLHIKITNLRIYLCTFCISEYFYAKDRKGNYYKTASFNNTFTTSEDLRLHIFLLYSI